MRERLIAVRKLLNDNALDAVLITNPVNRRYLSGFDGTAGVLLISSRQADLITDFRYAEQAAVQAKQFKIHRWQDDIYKSLIPLLESSGLKRIGFESGDVSYSYYSELKARLPAELVPLEKTAETERMIKSRDELAVLRRGAKILDRAFDFICSTIRPGTTEKELSLELEIFLLRQGAEEKSFTFIVASGKRGALPHGSASAKIMQPGELVTIDFGAVFDGYATDMTRTIALGKLDLRQRDIYGIVYRAQQNASAAVKPGITGNALDLIARQIIADAGYGQYFGHGLGHGVGLETHEQPVINPRSTIMLKSGMVITIEPGIYIDDWGGVRIEDMVAVTESGAEILTKSPRELIII